MAYTKYPKEIHHYHDLFEGDFFLPENQRLFSEVSETLKKKIYTILTRESTIFSNSSHLSHGEDRHTIHQLRRDHIAHGKGRQNPIEYITKLEDSDRNNLYELLFEIFYDDGDGLYRDGINRAFVIGSSTYGEEYRDELSQGPWRNDAAIQQRANKKGNDIDLLIGANLFASPHLGKRQIPIPNKDRESSISILNAVCLLLSKNKIPYTIEKHRKDGTSHLWLKDTNTGEIITHTGKIMDYHRPNIIVQLPSGRPIHIVADKEDISGAYKREFLEGRDYVCLFDDSRQRYRCKDIFEKTNKGESLQTLETLEERYNVLQENKRSYYINKLAYKQKRLVEKREETQRFRSGSLFDDDVGF